MRMAAGTASTASGGSPADPSRNASSGPAEEEPSPPAPSLTSTESTSTKASARRAAPPRVRNWCVRLHSLTALSAASIGLASERSVSAAVAVSLGVARMSSAKARRTSPCVRAALTAASSSSSLPPPHATAASANSSAPAARPSSLSCPASPSPLKSSITTAIPSTRSSKRSEARRALVHSFADGFGGSGSPGIVYTSTASASRVERAADASASWLLRSRSTPCARASVPIRTRPRCGHARALASVEARGAAEERNAAATPATAAAFADAAEGVRSRARSKSSGSSACRDAGDPCTKWRRIERRPPSASMRCTMSRGRPPCSRSGS
mmetsp:Transcript_27226/g.89227  ORF Transcript_27226/g.89227 Transcript_27226/m.89227 type:complete len:326 (+) Transcript_27226:2-979(+)